MVDRVYKADIPRLRRALEELKRKFSKLDTRTDWSRLRVDPLLKHVQELERILGSKEPAGEFSRLRGGVVFFHSDLVYLRKNVEELQRLVRSETAKISPGHRKRIVDH
jgi:hypothetical protein